MKLCGIEMDSIVDGPGIRMTIFFQGCPHHCDGCHNPESWDYDDVQIEMTVDEVLNLFDSDSILAGVTFSGGEPLSPRNFEDIIVLSKELKKRKKNIWLYTGYVLEDVLKRFPNLKKDLLPYVDVIVDGRFIIEESDLLLDFRGSRNQRLIDVSKYLTGEDDFILKR